MKINELAKLSGVTVRTLHYYDKIGLLKPKENTESGYRIYDETSLITLQQILFFRELDFPLANIKDIISSPSYNQKEALQKQKELLLQKRNRLDGLITLVEAKLKGEKIMSFKEFDMSEIEAQKKKYADEVKERWGNTEAYRESNKKTKSYDETQWAKIQADSDAIFKDFAALRHSAPESPQAQALVKAWQDCITSHFYNCTDEILSGLGQMYTADERFTTNIDKYGEGTAAFISKAIAVYCAH